MTDYEDAAPETALLHNPDAFEALPSAVDSNVDTADGPYPIGATVDTPLTAGDLNDDDAQYVATLFTAGNDPYRILVEDGDTDPNAIVPREPILRPQVTSLSSGLNGVPLALGHSPVMILPPDPFRKRFILWATGDFKFSGDANTAAQSGDFPGSSFIMDIADHTGAVWVAPASTATTTVVTVNALSVTGGC